MPYTNMTLEQLAVHIGMDARELRRLAERGSLPGRMIGGEWRFNQAALLDWLQQEIHALDERHVRNLERATSNDSDRAIVERLIATEGVDMNLPARSRASLMRELVNLVARTGMLYDGPELLRSLEERESLCSTALPGGIAFPHPRRPLPYATAEPLVCLARVPGGVPFAAPDGKLTFLFVLICSHEERAHLHVLARLALLFGDPRSTLRSDLIAIETNEAALGLMIATERQMLATRS